MLDKVYVVHTGNIDSNGKDTSNYSSYKTIAKSADKAIKNVKSKFGKGEYAESVELVIILD